MELNELVIVLILLLVAIITLVSVADRLNIPYPICLVVGGLILSVIPYIPNIPLSHDIIFIIFVPPLLLWEAINISLRDLWAHIRPISALVLVLVAVTTLSVGAIAHAVIGLSWLAAIILGAAIAPTDAVAADSIAQQLNLPGRIITIIEGESLFNDATGLVILTVALAAWHGSNPTPLSIGLDFLIISVGGILIGLAIGFAVNFIRRLLSGDPTLENILLLLTGFVAYLLAEELKTSGILAVVAAGLVLGSERIQLSSSYTRLQTEQFWSVIVFLLNSLLFILVGMQLYDINRAVISLYTPWTLLWYAGVIIVTTIAVRLAWVFLAYFLGKFFEGKFFVRSRKHGQPTLKGALVIGWSGMRGGISLAAVLALPNNFPGASLLIFIVYCVILATLVIQGLSLPWLIKKLDLANEDVAEVAETRARLAMARAAVRSLDQLIAESDVSTPALESLHSHYARLSHLLSARLGHEEDVDLHMQEVAHQKFLSIQGAHQEMIDAERQALTDMFEQHKISEEIMRRLNRELDLNEVLTLSRQNR